jgi:lambda family phage tail tape measure protein
MAAGSIVIDLLMKTGSFETDTKRAEKRLKEFEATAKKTALAVTAVATAAVAGFAAMAKSTINRMDEMSKMATQVGVTTEALSSLGYAAKLSGVEQGNLTQSLARLSKGMIEAANGTGEAKKAFDSLGINASTMRSADEALLQIADRFSKMEDGAQKTSLAMQLFGRSGAQLVPFLNQGRDGIAGLQREADRLGITLSGETGKAAEEFNDSLFRLQQSFAGIINNVVRDLLPAMQDFVDIMSNAWVQTDSLRYQSERLVNTGLVGFFDALGSGVAIVADSVVGLVKLLDAVSSSFQVVIADVKAMSAAATALVTNVTPGIDLISPGAKEKANKELETALSSRNKIVESANQKYIDLWSYQGDKFYQQWTTSRLFRQAGLGGEDPLGFSMVSPPSTAEQQTRSSSGTAAATAESNKFLQEMQKEAKAYEDFINQITGRADAARTQQQTEWLMLARSIGEISEQEYDVAIKNLNKVESQMSQFAIQAARNIQSILGDGLYNVMSGRFEDIGKSFVNMINRMLADLLASQLAQMLFGSFGTTGQLGGLIGAIGSGIGSAFANFGSGQVAMDVSPLTVNRGMGFEGFSAGGYTGAGGKYEPAGFVHRGEYVLNADATKRLGVGFLDKINQGYANGGYVGSMPSGGMKGMSEGVQINIINQSSQPVNARQSAPQFDGEKFVQNIVLSDLRRNGPIGQALRAGV